MAPKLTIAQRWTLRQIARGYIKTISQTDPRVCRRLRALGLLVWQDEVDRHGFGNIDRLATCQRAAPAMRTAGQQVQVSMWIAAQYPKACKCGQVYANPTEFDRLPWPVRLAETTGLVVDEVEIQMWRDCKCGSTLAVVVEVLDYPTKKQEVRDASKP